MKQATAILTVFFCATIACSDPQDKEKPQVDAAPTALSYEEHIQPIWDEHCLECHAGEFAQADLQLSAPNSRANLLARTDYRCFALDGGITIPLVAPGNTQESALWHLLYPDNPEGDGCGRVMPQGPESLRVVDPEAFALVEDWIEAGAQ